MVLAVRVEDGRDVRGWLAVGVRVMELCPWAPCWQGERDWLVMTRQYLACSREMAGPKAIGQRLPLQVKRQVQAL